MLMTTVLFSVTGNAAVVKPSEVCVHTAKVMEDLLPAYIDKVTHMHTQSHTRRLNV